MKNITNQSLIFSKDEISNFVNLYYSLKKVHNRLINQRLENEEDEGKSNAWDKSANKL